MSRDDLTPQEPKTQTETSRRGASGSPPKPPTSLGTHEGPNQPSPASRGQTTFGIDFGDCRTRIAGLCNGTPFMLRRGSFHSLPSETAHESTARLRSAIRCNNKACDIEVELLGKRLFAEAFEQMENYTTKQPTAVLTVPAYYSSNERQELIRYAETAGIMIVGLINDYAAVIQSLAYSDSSRVGKFLVLSIGATSVSTAVVNVSSTMIDTVTVRSAPDIGGDFLVDNIAKHLTQADAGDSPNSASKATVWQQRAQKLLSEQDNSSPPDWLTEIVSKSLADAMSMVEETMKEAKLSRSQIDQVVLVGGIMNSPIIANYLHLQLKNMNRLILNMDKAAAFGAALRAGVLTDSLKAAPLFEVLTQTVYKNSDGKIQTIIPAGTMLPTKVHVSATFNTTIEQNHFAAGQTQPTASRVLSRTTATDGTFRQEEPSFIMVNIDDNGVIQQTKHYEVQTTEA